MRELATAVVAVATVLLALPPSPARAHGDFAARPKGELTGEAPEGASPEVIPVHGDYDWIRRGGHLSADGKPCCGKDDCTPLAAAQVKQTPRGYALPEFGMVVPYAETLRSEDGKYWLCMTHSTRIRCFFAPPAAM